MTTKAYPEISSRRHQIVCRGAIELMIIICKEPRTDLGQKGGKSSDFNDDALSGSHENIWRMIKQRSHHYNKRAAINQSIVSTQPNNQNKFLFLRFSFLFRRHHHFKNHHASEKRFRTKNHSIKNPAK